MTNLAAMLHRALDPDDTFALHWPTAVGADDLADPALWETARGADAALNAFVETPHTDGRRVWSGA